MKTRDAIFIKTIMVEDEELSIYRDTNSNAIFGIDSSFISQSFDEDEDVLIPSPFNDGIVLKLIE